MQVQNVLKTDSLENVINGKFVFCKELKKGFIKGELSSLGLSDYSFENVATVIESLTLEELEANGLNTVIFVDGEEKISQKANLEIEELIAVMENPTAEMIFSLQTDRRLKRDYFDENFIQNIVDGLVPAFQIITAPTHLTYADAQQFAIDNGGRLPTIYEIVILDNGSHDHIPLNPNGLVENDGDKYMWSGTIHPNDTTDYIYTVSTSGWLTVSIPNTKTFFTKIIID